MDIYTAHEEDKFRNFKWIASKYYDYPDGEDLVGKLSYTTKLAVMGSSVLGLLHSHAAGGNASFSVKFFRFAKIVVPAAGMAATFTFVTYFSTVIRKKDDVFNYALGGAAAGLLLGPATGRPPLAFWGAFYCAIIGMAKKSAQLEGKVLIPRVRPSLYSSYYLRTLDTSLLPETDYVNRNLDSSSN